MSADKHNGTGRTTAGVTKARPRRNSGAVERVAKRGADDRPLTRRLPNGGLAVSLPGVTPGGERVEVSEELSILELLIRRRAFSPQTAITAAEVARETGVSLDELLFAIRHLAAPGFAVIRDHRVHAPRGQERLHITAGVERIHYEITTLACAARSLIGEARHLKTVAVAMESFTQPWAAFRPAGRKQAGKSAETDDSEGNSGHCFEQDLDLMPRMRVQTEACNRTEACAEAATED